MAKYTTKPVEARQWHKHGDDHDVVPAEGFPGCAGHPSEYGVMRTTIGPHLVYPGDWIIVETSGAKRPIRPDVFAQAYEPVAVSPPPPTVEEEIAEAERVGYAVEDYALAFANTYDDGDGLEISTRIELGRAAIAAVNRLVREDPTP